MALSLSERNGYWNGRFRDFGEIYGRDHSVILEEITTHLNLEDKILEIAGGYGRNAYFLADLGFNVTCTDISEEAIRIAVANYNHKRIVYEVKDALKLDYPEDYFDVVLSIYGMNVFSKDELNNVFAQAHKILRHNGKFINIFLSINDEEYGTGEKVDNDTFLVDNNKQMVKFFRGDEIKRLYTKNHFILSNITEKEEKRKIGEKILHSRCYLAIGSLASCSLYLRSRLNILLFNT